MLSIIVPANDDLWDPVTNEFISSNEVELKLEHSLLSLSKWEAIWKKPYLTDAPKTVEEYISYVKCMTLNKNVDNNAYYRLTKDNLLSIDKYIGEEMTATMFGKDYRNSKSRIQDEQITAELLYYYMFTFGIPMECQKWHLSRLTALIRICAIKQEPPKRMSNRDVINQFANLNESRLKKLKTRG